MIALESVTKLFGTKKAVDNIDLKIGKGEIFAFLGPNGAGKTTTIKMIAGLLRPTSGSVTVGGMDVQRDHLKVKQMMGYIPDQPYLYDKLSGLEFIHFMADVYGVDCAGGASAEGRGNGRQARIDRYIDLFSMRDYIRELSEGYSHGMRQRVALAAMLVHEPEVIVVDEPLVGLDPQTSKLVKEILRDQSRRGTTIFMSTHLISIAEEIADRIGIIIDGRVVALGSPREIREMAKTEGKLEEAFFAIVEDRGK